MKISVTAAGSELAESEIQQVAYLLWVEKGRPEGCDLETWLTAKERISHRRTPAAKSPDRRAKASASTRLVGKN